MVVGSDDIAHAADMGVVEKGDDGGFTGCTNLLGLVCPLLVCTGLVSIIGRATGDDFTGNLENGSWLDEIK